MSGAIENVPDSILLCSEGDQGGLDLAALGQYLREKSGVPFKLRRHLFEGCPPEMIEEKAAAFARIRIRDPLKRFVMGNPLPAEIDYERRRIKNPSWRASGILYEGRLYQEIAAGAFSGGEIRPGRCVIVVTNQLFGTWDRDDLRYHARVSLYGYPNLVSLFGLVEAPARPRSYHVKRRLGVPIERLRPAYEGRFLEHGDPRTAEVLKGYLMQAFFFHVLGDPFCRDRDCRLFNGHWQDEVLHAQLGGPFELCPGHEAVLMEIRGRAVSGTG